MPPVVEFKNLTKIYRLPGFLKSREVIGTRELSFEVEPGEIFGLLGLNGAGKTTAIRCLLGLIKPTSGSVTVLGREAALDAAVRSELGYLPESVAFAPALTPEEILTFMAGLDPVKFPSRERIRERVQAVLKIVGLELAGRRSVRTFSKGMNQRVGIAQAILHEPKVLVLDEPASGLDPLGIVEIRELFTKLNRELGMTILFSSHSIGEVERISNRVAIVAGNRLQKILQRKEWESRSLEEIFVGLVREVAVNR